MRARYRLGLASSFQVDRIISVAWRSSPSRLPHWKGGKMTEDPWLCVPSLQMVCLYREPRETRSLFSSPTGTIPLRPASRWVGLVKKNLTRCPAKCPH